MQPITQSLANNRFMDRTARATNTMSTIVKELPRKQTLLVILCFAIITYFFTLDGPTEKGIVLTETDYDVNHLNPHNSFGSTNYLESLSRLRWPKLPDVH